MDWQAIALSLKLALWVVVLLLPLGLVVAWFLVYGRFRGKILLDALVSLPLVLPPTVLGFYLIVAMGPRSAVGQGLGSPHRSGPGVLLFRTGGGLRVPQPAVLPPAVRLGPGRAWIGSCSKSPRPSARDRSAIYLRVAVPLAWRGLVAGIIMTFAHAIGEFGVVLMVGGNLPGVTRTASIALFDQVQALDMEGANQTALFLLGVSFTVLVCTSLLRAKERPWS